MAQGSGRGAQGRSRYDSSPVGGSGGEPRGAPGYDDGKGRQPDQPGGGGHGHDGGHHGHGGGDRPGGEGYGPGTPETPEQGYGPETPETPEQGYGPETPETPEQGYGPETPETPETPDQGYGPEEPGYEDEDHPEEPPTGHPCPPSMTCDTRSIDDLGCEAEGVKAESDELAAVKAALDARRTAFETARAAYTTARDEANQAVKDLNRKVDDLLDDTRCLLNRDEVECIDDAFEQVLDCLEDCDEEQGCCVGEDCGFADDCWTVGQIDDLRERVVKVEKCFDEVLVAEPVALGTRVADARTLVEELTEALTAEPREDANRLYARAKRARWVLDRIWGRFADVNEFQDCLCRGLTCSLQGRQWLAQLAGKKAYQECQEAARLRRCQWLRDNMVEETLATQLLLCPPGPPCGEPEQDEPEQERSGY